MKRIISVIRKSLKEQLRSFKVLLLSLLMGPFFILVYYLIIHSTQTTYDILVLQSDTGQIGENQGDTLYDFMQLSSASIENFPVTLNRVETEEEGLEKLRKNKGDVLLVIPEGFTAILSQKERSQLPEFKIQGDLMKPSYMLSAVIINEMTQEFLRSYYQEEPLFTYQELPLGNTGNLDDFSLMVPGIIILSVIMLMFTASIAFVSEVENKTIIRLKLSKLKSYEYLSGVSFVQMLVGMASVIVTYYTAVALGYEPAGSMMGILIPSLLASLSIIGFSLILAAYTRSANEILVVGNFPMFLFMFFTGAAFPMEGVPLLELGNYTLTLQGLMSPTHAISALHKIQNLGMSFNEVWPEMISLFILTAIYFVLGAWLFRRRHMR